MNTLQATITAVSSSQYLSSIQVEAEGEPFHLLLAEASDHASLLHTNVTLAFKETEVILTRSIETSTANIHQAVVQKIESGIILTQVTLHYHTSTVTALVPTLTFEILQIKQDDRISWMISPSEISLLRGPHGV